MSKMKYITNIDFNNMPTGDELEYEKTFNPILQWREEALNAYLKIKNENKDNLIFVYIVINNWIDYIHLTKGEKYAEMHRKLANENMMEEFRIAINGFNF